MTPATEARIRAAAEAFAEAIIDALDDEAPAGPDRLLGIDEAAAAMSLGRSTLYAEIGAGRLRSVKVGRRRLIPASAVAEYVRRAA